MNLLIDIALRNVDIEGEDYEINSDFRTSILFELLMQDDELSYEEKIVQALKLYYPSMPKNLNEAVEKMIWFYSCDKGIKESKGKGTGKSSIQIYNFEYDDDYIYGAFLDQYGIDLQDIEYLHWWKFKAMFKALKEDNEIVKIMGYRAMSIDSKMSKEQKKFYTNMKKIHEIPKSENDIQKINSIEEALMGAGDLSRVR
ncbi:MAG: bacteriophage Gp15 family protein [Clostridium sp.]|uniref:bacteriophage Gp15 family protein n=1 Tax=Clostridium sp. TaxID=1506 RepID=UPI00303A82C2